LRSVNFALADLKEEGSRYSPCYSIEFWHKLGMGWLPFDLQKDSVWSFWIFKMLSPATGCLLRVV